MFQRGGTHTWQVSFPAIRLISHQLPPLAERRRSASRIFVHDSAGVFLYWRIGIFIVMQMHMRTTIDVPDDLMRRTRRVLAARKMTFRALVIDAVERLLEAPQVSFKLRDASAGHKGRAQKVTNEAINRAINEAREPSFEP